jgi:hypothetical protein
LRTALPTLLPLAIAWAEARASDVAASGASLTEETINIARAVGVQRPNLVRIGVVQALPLPDHPALREAALQTGLLGPGMVGLTLGYSVLVCSGHMTPRLLSYEFRHVYQYESAGSISAFLPVYLQQIVEYGYDGAPFEADARSYERI